MHRVLWKQNYFQRAFLNPNPLDKDAPYRTTCTPNLHNTGVIYNQLDITWRGQFVYYISTVWLHSVQMTTMTDIYREWTVTECLEWGSQNLTGSAWATLDVIHPSHPDAITDSSLTASLKVKGARGAQSPQYLAQPPAQGEWDGRLREGTRERGKWWEGAPPAFSNYFKHCLTVRIKICSCAPIPVVFVKIQLLAVKNQWAREAVISPRFLSASYVCRHQRLSFPTVAAAAVCLPAAVNDSSYKMLSVTGSTAVIM